MKSEDAIEVLKSLLHEMRAAPAGMKESRFRAKHADQQDLIDTLIFHQGKILRQDGCVHLHPAAIAELAPVDPVAANLHAASSRVFLAVRERTKAGADENLPVETLANDLEMLPGDLIELLKPMADTGIFATYDLNSDKGYVLPSVVTVLRHKTYGELVDLQRALATSDADSPALTLMKHRALPRSAQSSYVDEQRLDALRSITSSEWDFTRLIRLCEELNTAHEGDAWMTCAMLVRGIVDHVPPIFSCANFSVSTPAGTGL